MSKFTRAEDIEIGSIWYAADGSGHSVKVVAKEIGEPQSWIKYSWKEDGKIKEHEKDTWSFQCRYYLPDNKNSAWPKPGDKVKFEGAKYHWFKDLIDSANNLLTVGEEYTLTSVRVLSSWVKVKLKEFPDDEFALSFFNYEGKYTEKETLAHESEHRHSDN
jgi:hypothetical protein